MLVMFYYYNKIINKNYLKKYRMYRPWIKGINRRLPSALDYKLCKINQRSKLNNDKNTKLIKQKNYEDLKSDIMYNFLPLTEKIFGKDSTFIKWMHISLVRSQKSKTYL